MRSDREDAVEAPWAAVEPILEVHPRAIRYKRGEWGAREADALIADDGGRWDDPGAEMA
jgi:glucose-6-phosphate 1-dehydrogenase